METSTEYRFYSNSLHKNERRKVTEYKFLLGLKDSIIHVHIHIMNEQIFRKDCVRTKCYFWDYFCWGGVTSKMYIT